MCVEVRELVLCFYYVVPGTELRPAGLFLRQVSLLLLCCLGTPVMSPTPTPSPPQVRSAEPGVSDGRNSGCQGCSASMVTHWAISLTLGFLFVLFLKLCLSLSVLHKARNFTGTLEPQSLLSELHIKEGETDDSMKQAAPPFWVHTVPQTPLPHTYTLPHSSLQ